MRKSGFWFERPLPAALPLCRCVATMEIAQQLPDPKQMPWEERDAKIAAAVKDHRVDSAMPMIRRGHRCSGMPQSVRGKRYGRSVRTACSMRYQVLSGFVRECISWPCSMCVNGNLACVLVCAGKLRNISGLVWVCRECVSCPGSMCGKGNLACLLVCACKLRNKSPYHR